MILGGVSKKVLAFILKIGADSQDSEYIRLVKRIYYAGSCLSLPLTFLLTLLFFIRGDFVFAAIMMASFAFFLWFICDGALYPKNFERNATFLTVYFVLTPFLLAFLEGGIWRANGGIYIGLLGPLYALLLPNKRWALQLFGLYALLVGVFVIIEPYFANPQPEITGFRLFLFWYGFLIIAAFVFGATYFFVIQRDKAYHLLGLEKEKSERLLKRIEKDLERAASIQRDLLPKEDPSFEDFDIAGANLPCYQVGGDYYDFISIDKDRLGVVIADVAGKGISASLLMASLRAALLAEVESHYDIQRMAGRLNDFVFKSSPINSFITFVFCDIDRRSGAIRYVNAGHNPPFVMGKSGRSVNLESSGFALGMFPNAAFEPGGIQLESEDVLVLYTDGIPEARSETQREYTEERMKGLVKAHRDLPAKQLSTRILDDVRDFAEGTEQADDITLVIIKKRV
jgi:serine phosphatase RsbU (regulator of sigma subunit)